MCFGGVPPEVPECPHTLLCANTLASSEVGPVLPGSGSEKLVAELFVKRQEGVRHKVGAGHLKPQQNPL